MDDFSEAKKDVLHCLGLVAEDIIDLPNSPHKTKVQLIINEMYEIMRKLSDIAED